MKIDTSQINAIRHKDGPELVLAGPGSGKTLVITRRVQHLIDQYHVPPSAILVITFTKAAATEMRQRFEKLMGGRRVPVSFGTFHAVYFMILKHAYGYTADNIVKEEQRLQFMKEYIRRLRLEYDDENEFISSLFSEISLIKNTSVNLAHYYSSCCGQDVFRNIFEAYENFLHQNRFIDFDDMLVYCKELLVQRPDILAAWQRKYQDINQIQYDIIRMLAAPQDNLFIVGDDDQSIYRFRGARPEIMLNFTKDYPDAGKVILDTNYRSGAEIVRHAGNLISFNQKRFEKKIAPAAKTGIPVVKQEFQTQREQNLYVIQEILRLHREGMEYKDMAVLFRTNMQPRFLMEMMLDYSISFTAKDRIPNIYDHWITRDLFAYIDIARGDRRRSTFLKIMNRPKRYLSRESLPYEEVAFDVWEEYYEEQGWMVQRLEKLQMDLKVIAGMRPYSAINYIRKGVAYEDYLREYAEVRRIPFEDLADVLDELQENARGFETFDSWFEHIKQLREELEEQAKSYKVAEGVNLSTLHSSKGLEYDTVFLVDVNENVMPNKKAVLDADLEEERRMFYVGMTRAKNRLYLLWSHQIRNKDMDPSRFLIECESAQTKR